MPWPSDIPKPLLDPASETSQTRVFDARYLERARSLVTPGVNNFVTVDGRRWAFSIFPVLPEHLYREKVVRAIWRREWELEQAAKQ